MRTILPHRRHSFNFDVEFPTHTGKLYAVSAGCSDDLLIYEVFLSSYQKPDSQADLAARDIAILISFNLQHGTPLEVMAQAAMKDASGAPDGLAGIVLNRLVALQAELVKEAVA